uniref:Uncharacterized protein n=1 Tax=Anopheles melas TaxID=34690 RepID=A0A182TLK3_9DIPT
MPLDYVYQHLTEPSNAGCFVSLQCVPHVKRAVSPETVIIPIVSCIIGFPILALLVICCLRRRAKLARDRDRRRNIDLQDHAVSLNSFNSLMTGASNISDIPNAIRNEMTALPKKAVIWR